ncbi:MAG: CCA tRNA nucleotidyltransferase [Clostridiaceae bacterium]|nr:CCA tRNA nucleotidyltransferase [Eubacteriales bacterium]
MQTIPISEALRRLAALFLREGFSLYAVGGMVRNPLLNYPVSDTDICSAMEPERLMALCARENIRQIPKGISYGTLELHVGGESFEHTTFRADTYGVGGAHRPEAVAFSKTPEEDAFRRDFTVNALYYDISADRLIDPAGGLRDLENRVIRATSADPGDILRDDGLRILRMVRFAGELGFSVEENTFRAATENAEGLRDISPERVRGELDKILLCDVRYRTWAYDPLNDAAANGSPVLKALLSLESLGALKVILPELSSMRGVEQKTSHHRYDVLDHSFHACACAPAALGLRLAGLLHDTGKPESVRLQGNMHGHEARSERISREILTRLRYPNAVTDEVCALVKHHMYDLNGDAREFKLRLRFVSMGKENAQKLIRLREADVHGSGVLSGPIKTAEKWKTILERMDKENVPWSENALDCTGKDIMAWLGLAPSPRVGSIKKRLFEHCVRYPKDNKKEILKKLAGGMNHI